MLLSSGASRAQAPEPLSIVIFGPPSLGAFLPPVIKAQKLDMCGPCLEGKTAQY
jgi:NitT/TauT family transport system substrate-binding protein